MKFLENWNLLNSLYKHFNNHSELEVSVVNDDSRSNHGITPFPGTKTPKRSFDQAFGLEPQFYQKTSKESAQK